MLLGHDLVLNCYHLGHGLHTTVTTGRNNSFTTSVAGINNYDHDCSRQDLFVLRNLSRVVLRESIFNKSETEVVL